MADVARTVDPSFADRLQIGVSRVSSTVESFKPITESVLNIIGAVGSIRGGSYSAPPSQQVYYGPQTQTTQPTGGAFADVYAMLPIIAAGAIGITAIIVYSKKRRRR